MRISERPSLTTICDKKSKWNVILWVYKLEKILAPRLRTYIQCLLCTRKKRDRWYKLHTAVFCKFYYVFTFATAYFDCVLLN